MKLMALGVPFGEGRGAHTQGPSPYGMLYETRYRRVTAVPIRPATREEWLASLDTYGWPARLIETIAGPGHRTVAVIGGPHRDNDPEKPLFEVKPDATT